MKHIQILRKPSVLEQLGWGRSTLHSRINQGLFVPPISLGPRAVGWLQHEVDAVVQAMVAGESEASIKATVQSLLNRRTSVVQGGCDGE